MKTSSKIFLVCISLAVILNTAVLQVAAASDEIAYDSVHPVQAVVAAVIAVLVAVGIFLYRNHDLLFGRGKKENQANGSEERSRLGNWVPKAFLVMFLDVLIIVASYLLALMLRFDFTISSIPEQYFYGYQWSMYYWAAATVVTFYGFRMYHSIWSLASMPEMIQCVKAYIMLLLVYLAGTLFMGLRMPRSYYFMGYLLSFILTTGMRFSYRLLRQYMRGRGTGGDETQAVPGDRVMVIGGGSAGQALISDIIRRGTSKVCCIIDDNSAKQGRTLDGIPIVGGRNDIPDAVKKYKIDRIIYAIPAASEKDRKEILNICKETDCKLQTVPSLNQLANGEVTVQRLRDVDITDLLGREQVDVNDAEIQAAICGQVILVTGGGGSIGSELCRQIAAAHPKQLIIFDVYENNAFDIQQELERNYPELDLVVLIGSVRDTNRVNQVVEQYRPDAIFHAAAHKHVPLMEESPNEAIKNNVIGTYKVARAAAEYGVKRFVLISTDKAVNPTSVMGASKRICEMVVQMMDRAAPDTDFVAVRFGNVLGSNGSVIPLFKKQIEEGGPVTVTDKNIVRYFMTIPEAVSLILQAFYYAKGGEIFVLDMGEPVKIDDMARNLIRLSGLKPDEDIQIVYTGLRPGEKLYEELLMNEEGLQETDNKLIYIGQPIEMDDDWFREKLTELDTASQAEDPEIRKLVAEVVPTYHYEENASEG